MICDVNKKLNFHRINKKSIKFRTKAEWYEKRVEMIQNLTQLSIFVVSLLKHCLKSHRKSKIEFV